MSSALPSYEKGYRHHKFTPATRSTFRRRRIIWSAILLFAAFCGFLYFSPSSLSGWSVLPANLKDPEAVGETYHVGSSNYNASGKLRIHEIHGLLHFLTSERTESMSLDRVHAYGDEEEKSIDWTSEVNLNVFSAGVDDDDWPRNVRELTDRFPIVVFSKTYCPFSKRAKALLDTYKLSPPPKIIEVDLRSDANILKQLLGRLTGRSTFPNILLTRKIDRMSIGGSDDIHELDENGELKGILQQAGLKVNGAIEA